MKRLITLFAVVLLLAVVLLVIMSAAVAETSKFTPYDYHVMYTANGKYVVYDFPDVMLYLPIEWKDAIIVEQTDNGTSFYQTASYEKYQEEGIPGGGYLFGLCASEDESFRELPEYEYIGFSENAGLHFYLMLPSDYPAWLDDAAIKAEYDEMSNQISEVVEMAKIHKSMHFYTDDIETTDAGMS